MKFIRDLINRWLARHTRCAGAPAAGRTIGVWPEDDLEVVARGFAEFTGLPIEQVREVLRNTK